MFCKKCGAQIEDNSKFCMHCGQKLSEHDKTYTFSISKRMLLLSSAGLVLVLCLFYTLSVHLSSNKHIKQQPQFSGSPTNQIPQNNNVAANTSTNNDNDIKNITSYINDKYKSSIGIKDIHINIGDINIGNKSDFTGISVEVSLNNKKDASVLDEPLMDIGNYIDKNYHYFSINLLFNFMVEYDKKPDLPTWYSGSSNYNENTHKWEVKATACWGTKYGFDDSFKRITK